jgi:hypothetical protein
MQIIETSIVIQAPVEHVWAILTDIDNYRNWNPFIVDVCGQLLEGQKIQFHKAMRGGAIPNYSRVDVFNAENHRLCWTTTYIHALFFRTMNSFTLEALDEKSACLIQVESQQGFVSILSLPSMLHSLRSSMVSMNKALKRHAEDNQHLLPHSLTSGA